MACFKDEWLVLRRFEDEWLGLRRFKDEWIVLRGRVVWFKGLLSELLCSETPSALVHEYN